MLLANFSNDLLYSSTFSVAAYLSLANSKASDHSFTLGLPSLANLITLSKPFIHALY